MTYPYALGLIEEDMLMQAWRLAQNQPVFVPPNAEFVPQVYMPLFTTLGGWLLRLTGFGFWPLRLISFLSTLGTAVLIGLVGRRESGHWLIGFSGTALYLAGHRMTGGWFDLARVDALFTLLALAGMSTAVYAYRSKRGLVFAGLLMGLALLTKQNGLFLGAIVGVFLWWMVRKDVWLYAATFVVVTAVPLTLWQINSDGWFGYYVIDIAYANPLLPIRLWRTFYQEFVGAMGPLLILVLGTAVWTAWQRQWQRLAWPFFIGAGCFVSWVARAPIGGNLNNLMLGYALLCLGPALAWHVLETLPQRWVPRVGGALLLAIFLQFALTQVNLVPGKPAQLLPTAEMQAAGDAMLSQVLSIEGEVWVMMYPSYAVRVGKEPAVHIQSLWHGRRRGQDPLPPDLVQQIENQNFTVIISSNSDFFETDPALLALLDAHYERERTLSEAESPPTLSGPVIRPLFVYAPR